MEDSKYNKPGSVGESLHKMLCDNGLWPKEADAVLHSITEDNCEPLAEVLDKEWSGYPRQFHTVAWMTVKQKAVEYIDEHKPKHFARPMFV